MKIFSLGGMLTLSAVASAALAAPQGSARLTRDVSELLDASVMDYVPPATEYLPADAATELPTAVRGDDGYEYRTVRRLKLRLRNRRDVSHLSARYLPPPSNNYLPPAVVPTPAAPAPADDTEEIVSAVEPKLAREYLPPVEEAVVSTEAPAVETEAPAVQEELPQPEADVRVVDVPTAELRDDGYHYKQPEEMPAELKEAAKDYLPPLGADVMAEGPANGESAVLTKDGYQYRAIRRYRF
ncbi:uncharacterized protein LOC117788228 [Drosophila innubila]|uniref:uncharacterized protein LOC117788228 n=1 Tax=Drosophila innubila TaxID=198719 RepID=UPI00148C10CD|nr:uncharacterized protein LOC117788228 [Drosophila innubila]